jgi:hypothetical protein
VAVGEDFQLFKKLPVLAGQFDEVGLEGADVLPEAGILLALFELEALKLGFELGADAVEVLVDAETVRRQLEQAGLSVALLGVYPVEVFVPNPSALPDLADDVQDGFLEERCATLEDLDRQLIVLWLFLYSEDFLRCLVIWFCCDFNHPSRTTGEWWQRKYIKLSVLKR